MYLLLSTENCDLNLQDRDEMTPLHLAIKRNNPRLIEAIISVDHQPQVDPNVVNRYGQTPLHTAASMGYDEIVRQLLLSGLKQPCDPTLTDSHDCTAYDLAKRNHHETCAKLIEEYQQKSGKRILSRGLSVVSTHESSSLKAVGSISLTPQANLQRADDETSEDSSSSMDSQKPIRQVLKRPSDQWSDEYGSTAVGPMKTLPTFTKPKSNSPSIATLIHQNPLQSTKKTKTCE